MGAKTEGYVVRITENADKDLDEIFYYISEVKFEPLNARRVIDKIRGIINESIALYPRAFPECKEIPTKTKIYRRAVCYRYLIVYKIKGNEIIILGIIYGGRHPKHIRKLRKIK